MNPRLAHALKHNYDFDTDDIGTLAAVRPIIVASLRDSLRTNKWATRQQEIRNACRHLTEEEVRLYEGAALTSWESR